METIDKMPERIELPNGWYWELKDNLANGGKSYRMITPSGEDTNWRALEPFAQAFAAAMQGEGMGEADIDMQCMVLHQVKAKLSRLIGEGVKELHGVDIEKTYNDVTAALYPAKPMSTHPQPSASADAMECARKIKRLCKPHEYGDWVDFIDEDSARKVIQQFVTSHVAELTQRNAELKEALIEIRHRANRFSHGDNLTELSVKGLADLAHKALAAHRNAEGK